MKKIEIHTEYITLSQFLKLSGAVLSGGEAKELIADGEVRINGEVDTRRGAKLRGGEIISVCGQEYEVARCS